MYEYKPKPVMYKSNPGDNSDKKPSEYKSNQTQQTSHMNDLADSKTPDTSEEIEPTSPFDYLADNKTSDRGNETQDSSQMDDLPDSMTPDNSGEIELTSPFDYLADSKTPNRSNETQESSQLDNLLDGMPLKSVFEPLNISGTPYSYNRSANDTAPITINIDPAKKPTIYISIAEHQPYFKGGDGDFIDCIQHEINDLQYNCIRIIEKLPDNFPIITSTNFFDGNAIDETKDKIDPSNAELENLHLMELIIAQKIIVLDEHQTHQSAALATNTTHMKQEKLLNILEQQHISPKLPCILCIGSRMRRDAKNTLIDSGSLFSGHFLQTIKNKLGNNIKIIIFPLEHKFFIRSMKTLMDLQCQLEEHIVHADSIHFLNDHDLSYFKKIHRNPDQTKSECDKVILLKQKTLKPHKHLTDNSQEIKDITIPEDRIADDEFVQIRNIRTCMISGIYTTAQLTCDDINRIPLTTETFLYMLKNEITSISPIARLCQRPKKLLWFGMVRPNKGLDNPDRIIELIDKLKLIEYRFVIAGSFDIDETINIITKKIQINIVDAINIVTKKIQNSIFLKLMKKTLDRCPILSIENATNKKKKNAKDPNKQIIQNEIANIITTLKDKILTTNEIYALIYNSLKTTYPDAFDYEIHFGPTSQQLKEIAFDCRYALKLDDKGMANNASSIVSTLGLFLPTITSVGMLTGNDFRDSRHTITKTTIRDGKYKHTILTEYKQYKTTPEEDSSSLTKVEPISLTPDEICLKLSKETDELYKTRIKELYKLNKPQQEQIEQIPIGQIPTVLSMFHPRTTSVKILSDISDILALTATQISQTPTNT